MRPSRGLLAKLRVSNTLHVYPVPYLTPFLTNEQVAAGWIRTLKSDTWGQKPVFASIELTGMFPNPTVLSFPCQ